MQLGPPQLKAILIEGLQTIERNAKLQARIIEDLLDVSRIISGKLQLDLQPTSMAAVINAALVAIQPIADAQHVAITQVLEPGLPVMRVDVVRDATGRVEFAFERGSSLLRKVDTSRCDCSDSARKSS